MNRRLFYACIFTLLTHAILQAGGWSRKPGELALKLSWFSLNSGKRFSTGGGLESKCILEQSPNCFRESLDGGVKIPIFSDIPGTTSSRALFLTANYGLFNRLELGVQIGFFSSDNNFQIDVPREISTGANGLSDLYTNLKYQYLSRSGLAASVAGGFIAPTGHFERSAFGVSLGQGGWSYEVTHDLGYSFWPLPVYANAQVGYRWRGENEAFFNYGDEVVFNFEAGVHVSSRLLFKLALHGLNAGNDRQSLGIGLANTPGRKISFLSPTVFVKVKKFEIEAGVEHAVSGRNYVTGTKLNLGIGRLFNLK